MLNPGDHADLTKAIAVTPADVIAPRLEQLAQSHPDDAQLWFMLGAARHRLRNLQASLEAFGRVLSLSPAHLQAMNAMSGVLAELGRLQEAISLLRDARRLHPQESMVSVNLGYLLEQTEPCGREALQCYDAALAIEPANRAALMNRGYLLTRLGRLAEALDNNRRLTVCHPRDAIAHYNVAETLLALGRNDEVLEACDKALELASDAIEPLIVSGLALSVMGRFDEAREMFLRAENKDVSAVRRLMTKSTAPFGHGTEEFDPEIIYLARGYERVNECDWRARDAYISRFSRLMQERIDAGGEIRDPSLVYDALTLPIPGSLSSGIAHMFSKCLSLGTPAKVSAAARSRGGARRLKIGYLSPDFREHLNAYLLRPIIEFHDRSLFDVVCYSSGPKDASRIRDRARSAADKFVDIEGLETDAVVERIADDGIDILVDTGGFTTFSRPDVLVRQPAPIQVSYLGFPGTLGMKAVQYRISDGIATPSDQQQYWTESLVFLPDTFFIYDAADLPPAPRLTRAEYGLPGDCFVFCAFHNYYKLEPNIFEAWMMVLKAVPGSVLWLSGRSSVAVDNLCREATLQRVAPERLVFAPFEERDRYLARFALADLFLDTPVFNAMTTACDALAAGLPVLTCPGESFTSRVAASVLTAARFTEGIAGSLQDYCERAIAWGLNPGRLRELRCAKLSDVRTTPLFDARARVRQLEAAYQAMWRRHELGLTPAPFEVSRKRAESAAAKWY